MSESLPVRVLEDERTASEGRLSGPLELGRQQAGEPDPYAWLPADSSTPSRLIIARQDERDNVSRRHAFLEPLPSGRVRLTNRSRVPLPCDGVPGGVLAAGAAAELEPPFSFTLPGRTVAVGAAGAAEESGLHSLDEPTVGPGRLADLSGRLRSLPALTAPQLNDLVGWLQTTMGVLQATVGAADFLEKATEALVQIVGLDLGRVLLLDKDQWAVAAAHGEAPPGDVTWHPSRHVLTQVREQKKTFWQSSRPSGRSPSPRSPRRRYTRRCGRPAAARAPAAPA
ncbi:MAG TPA: hypothetical protein VKA46_35825 [Gemmataceae bacterium]|nr:hypothetical protein [Gemmataceae bacterium]